MPVVQAVGIATAHGSTGESYAQKIASVMMDALKKAQAEGITDQDKIRGLMLEARDKFLEGNI
jgi:hypothetical protein